MEGSHRLIRGGRTSRPVRETNAARTPLLHPVVFSGHTNCVELYEGSGIPGVITVAEERLPQVGFARYPFFLSLALEVTGEQLVTSISSESGLSRRCRV